MVWRWSASSSRLLFHVAGATDLAGYIFLALGTLSDVAAAANSPAGLRLWIARRQTRFPDRLGNLCDDVSHRDLQMVWGLPRPTGRCDAGAGASRERRLVRDCADCRSAMRWLLSGIENAEGGIGRFCRERETTVVSAIAPWRRRVMRPLAVADPQAEAATRLVAWLSGGFLADRTGDDFSMVRLFSFTVLAQVAVCFDGREDK